MQLNSSFTQLPSEMTKPALWGRSTLEMGATHWPESFRHLCRLLRRQEQSQGIREVPSLSATIHHLGAKSCSGAGGPPHCLCPLPASRPPEVPLTRARTRDAKKQPNSRGAGGLLRLWPLRLSLQPATYSRSWTQDTLTSWRGICWSSQL